MISSHLFKRNKTYYFRLYLPQDIAPYFSRNEIWKSLKTKNYKSAKTTILKLLYSTERLFLHLRSGMYTDTQMKRLVKDYLNAVLNRVESLRSIAMVRYESDGQQQIIADTEAEVIVDTSINAIDELIALRKIKLLKNDFSGVSTRLDWYIQEKSLTIDKESVEYATFCREILKAEIEVLKVEKERMSGNYDNDYDNYRVNSVVPTPAPAQPANTPKQGVLLSKIVEEHIKEATLANSWTEKTERENVSIYKVMMSIIGDRDINTIDKGHSEGYVGK